MIPFLLFRMSSGEYVPPPTPEPDQPNRPGERRSNWLWRFRDEEPEEVKIEEIKEVLVKQLKKVQKKAPDRNPAKQIATLAGRTVEQVEAITVESIAQSVLPAISESLAENQLSIGDMLQDQAILYALIRSHVAKVDQDEKLRLFLQDDEEAAEILLLM